jgi:hypothetical protein
MAQYKVISSGSLYGSLVIASTATQIKVGASDLTNRHHVLVHNPVGSGNTVYIGFDSSVTTSNGLPIEEGEERGFDLDPSAGISLYGIAAANTTVRIAEIK